VKTFIGLILVLAGGGVMLLGICMAVYTLISMYSGVLNDPMSDAGPQPKEVSETMIHWAIIGGIGAPFFLIGSMLLKVTLLQKLLGLASGKKAAKRGGGQAITTPKDRYPTAMSESGQSPPASSGQTPPR